MMLIKLTRGLFAKVDDSDFSWLNQWKWCARRSKSGFYASRYDGGKSISMARTILGMPDNNKLVAEHKDLDTLNNQRNNLRIATHTQNNINKPKNRIGTSKYKGVSKALVKSNNTIYEYWVFQIYNGGKRTRKFFKSETDAAIAYNDYAKTIHGEFAYLNNLTSNQK